MLKLPMIEILKEFTGTNGEPENEKEIYLLVLISRLNKALSMRGDEQTISKYFNIKNR